MPDSRAKLQIQDPGSDFIQTSDPSLQIQIPFSDGKFKLQIQIPDSDARVQIQIPNSDLY